MQDTHATGGGGGIGGRFLGGGDRRLRPHGHQALKCPRCDSLNTKFCYHNNYNLSQPRHFCKCCRRYWTKGGVLRNVPVGGGCRKSKRSKPKTDAVGERKSNQSSSSESSSLTAATTAVDPASKGSGGAGAAEEGTALTNTTTSTSAAVYNFPDPSRFFDVNPPSTLDHQLVDHQQSTDGQILTTEMRSHTSLMTSSEEMMGFGVRDVRTASYQGPASENPGPGLVGTTGAVNEYKIQDIRGVSYDGTLAAALDWGIGGGGGGGGQGFFDLTAAVDPAYWSPNQWTVDNDQNLNYLP